MPLMGANTQNMVDSVLERVRADQGPIYEAAAKVEGFTERMDDVEGIAASVDNRISAIEPAVIALELSDTHINLRAEGLSLDGVTDETAEFQAIINAAPAGSTITLDDRAKLVLSEQVGWNGKSLSIDGRGGIIKWTAKRSDPLMVITNSANVTLSNLNIEGAESTHDLVFDTQAFALSMVTCHDAIIENIRVRNVSRGLNLSTCQRATINGWYFYGMATAFATNINFVSGIRLMGCHDAKIARIYAENCGSTLLVGSTSQRGQVIQASGLNNYDNGIYISSGVGWEITGPSFRFDDAVTENRGTGVKMRGSDNTLLGGYFYRMGVGAVITGTGGADIGGGFDGRGSRIIGAKAIDPFNLGFAIEDAGNLPCRDGVIADCYTEGYGWGGLANAAGFRVMTGRGHKLIGNTAYLGSNSEQAFLVSGSSTTKLRDILLLGNSVRNPAQRAFAINYVDRALIVGNTMDTVTGADYGMRLVETTNCEISLNKANGTVGTTAAIRINDATSTGNTVFDNASCTYSNNGSNSRAWGNLNGNPAVTGSRGGNAALTSLLAEMATQRKITNSTTA